MKKLVSLALGIVTSVGGFLEIGSITTAAQAGAGFGYQLLWTIVLGTACIACLVEMSGRFAAVSRQTLPAAMRERFGANFFVITLIVFLAVSLLVLAAEIGGMAAAFELATGWAIPVWVIPLAIGSCLLLWRCSFSLIENGVSLLGMVTLAFLVGAMKLHPSYAAVGRGMIPSLPHAHRAHYWFVAVCVLGASITPSLYYFYASGAIEEKWDESYVAVNRAIAVLGMAFGGVLSAAVLVLAALVFHPRGVDVEHYQQLPELLTGVFGRRGFWFVVVSLGVACLGATLEIALALAYTVAQGFGWKWGEDTAPRDAARFSVTYTLLIIAAALFVLIGVDPLTLTQISMSLTAASLPVGVFPFLILMNDRKYLPKHRNGHIGNAIVMGISALAAVLAVVSIPLELLGGG